MGHTGQLGKLLEERVSGLWHIYGYGIIQIDVPFLCRGYYLNLGSTLGENAFVARHLRLLSIPLVSASVLCAVLILRGTPHLEYFSRKAIIYALPPPSPLFFATANNDGKDISLP